MAEWAPAPECFSELWLQFGKRIISSGCVGRGRSALTVKCLSLWSSLYFYILPFPFVFNGVPCRRLSDSSARLRSAVRMLPRSRRHHASSSSSPFSSRCLTLRLSDSFHKRHSAKVTVFSFNDCSAVEQIWLVNTFSCTFASLPDAPNYCSPVCF